MSQQEKDFLNRDLGKAETEEEVKAIVETAELLGHEDVVELARQKLGAISAKAQQVETTPLVQVSQVEGMGGSSAEVEIRTADVDAQIDAVRAEAEGKMAEIQAEVKGISDEVKSEVVTEKTQEQIQIEMEAAFKAIGPVMGPKIKDIFIEVLGDHQGRETPSNNIISQSAFRHTFLEIADLIKNVKNYNDFLTEIRWTQTDKLYRDLKENPSGRMGDTEEQANERARKSPTNRILKIFYEDLDFKAALERYFELKSKVLT